MTRALLLALSLSVIFQGVASAQQSQKGATGEAFVFELRADYWFPTLSSALRADSGNYKGTNIDVVRDLGFDDKKSLPSAELTIKFAERHKLRFDYLDFAYQGDKVASSNVIFNGVVYPVNSRLKTDFQLRSIKAGYEYDIVRGDGGYLAFRIAADNAAAKASIETSGTISTSASASAIAPVVGISGRFFPTQRISITGDICGMSFNNSSVYDGSIYAGMSYIKNLGFTVGWRIMRIGLNVESKVSDTQWSGAFAGFSFRL
jgi:hypothetical protein